MRLLKWAGIVVGALAVLLLIAVGYPLLLLVPGNHEWLVPALFVFGLGYGGMLPAIPILSLHYFGRRDLGKVLGAMKIVYDVSAAGAPLFTAWLKEVLDGGTRVPIIALTANTMPEDRRACLDAGMDEVLPKPVSLPLLRTLLAGYGSRSGAPPRSTDEPGA